MEKRPVCPPHKFRRRNLTRSKDKEPYFVYKCIECPHYVPTLDATGVVARCYTCDKEFTVSRKKVYKMAKLRCDDCIKYKPETLKIRDEVDELIEKMMKEI